MSAIVFAEAKCRIPEIITAAAGGVATLLASPGDRVSDNYPRSFAATCATRAP